MGVSNPGGGSGSESDPVASAALTTHAALTTAAHGGLLPSSTVLASIVGDVFDGQRSSEVSTMPRLITNTQGVAATSGAIYVGRAVARTAGAFTKARWASATSGGASGITAARLGVWDDSNVRLADVALSTTAAAGTLFDNIALGSTVNVTAGQVLWLGIVFVGTTPPIYRGWQGHGQMGQLTPIVSKVQTGYSSGALPNPLVPAAGGSSFVPWIELVP